MAVPMKPSREITRLIEIMAALRTPVTGCPWDLAQNFETIAPYTLEEAYEVADAIERRDLADLKDELGDLLLQVVYHSRMAEEAGAFSFGDVVEGVTKKMIRRHPHVFGDEKAASPGDVDGLWARIKAEEKAEKAAARVKLGAPQGAGNSVPIPSMGRGRGLGEEAGAHIEESRPNGPPTPNPSPQGGGEFTPTLLADIPAALPALARALKLQDKAAKVGFDWPSLAPVFEKLKEELREFEEVALPHDPRALHARAEDATRTPLPSTGRGRGWGEEAGAHIEAPRPNSPPTPNPSPQGGGDFPAASVKEEFGDILFVLANVARHLKIDPEGALRAANQKFIRRFHHIERRLAGMGREPAQSNLAEMDALWDEAKALEKPR